MLVRSSPRVLVANRRMPPQVVQLRHFENRRNNRPRGEGGPVVSEGIHPHRAFNPGQRYSPAELDWTGGKTTFGDVRVKWPTAPEDEVPTVEDLTELNPFNVKLLSAFVTTTGRIMPRRATGLRAKAQRKLARAIKTSRQLGLMPYTSKLTFDVSEDDE